MNLNRLRKEEILKLASIRCKHNHTLLEHPACVNETLASISSVKEKVGYLDIESTGLNANWDYVISVFIADKDNGVWGRTLTKAEVLNYKVLDRNLMKELCKKIREYDKIVVYWGKDRRHDIPYLRTRASKFGFDFPEYGSLVVVDLYDVAKSKLRLHRYRLENVCKLFKIKAKEHPLDEDIWQKAKLGDKKSLQYIAIHCKEDVISLRNLDKVLSRFYGRKRTSI